jgi:hypothetical protein
LYINYTTNSGGFPTASEVTWLPVDNLPVPDTATAALPATSDLPGTANLPPTADILATADIPATAELSAIATS